MRNFRKSQTMLEPTIVFVVSIVLLGGLFNIWLWANKQIVKRQAAYNNTRLIAGIGSDSYVLRWPVYAPDSLTEDKVILPSPLE